jgi:hypothetical protein
VVVNYSSGAARAEEVVAQVKAAGGQAIAVGGSVGKVGALRVNILHLHACVRRR